MMPPSPPRKSNLIVLKPRRVSFDRLPRWAQQQFFPTDQVVIEATTNAWDDFRQILQSPRLELLSERQLPQHQRL
jgi:hypothetical protein